VTLSAVERCELLQLARRSIEAGLREGRRAAYPGSPILPPGGPAMSSFVTLRIKGELRGCCGTITAERDVGEDIWRNAWASAFADPRFAALGDAELSRWDIHISVLTPPEPLPVTSEAELLSVLRPNVDGLVLEMGGARATFLPAVWQQLQRPLDFVRQLKRKAGWPQEYWSPQLRALRYQAEEFGESD